MKLIWITLVVAATLQVNANGYAQNTVTLSEHNSSLLKVFKEIKKQTGYSCALPNELFAHSGKVNLQVTNVDVTEALDIIFREQPLVYEIIGKRIIVKERDEIADLSMNVQGRVVNENGKPVEGVTVAVKGTGKLTITNANGEFSLVLIDPGTVLVFTNVDMEVFEVSISLPPRIIAVNNMVVTINTGYQALRRGRTAAAVIIITKDELAQQAAPDILSKLEGITSGLVFNKEANSRNRIRGKNMHFNSNPLVVLDGFLYDGDINNINPNNIENIIILKDAAASANWGIRATNGVIVITTRKGKTGQHKPRQRAQSEFRSGANVFPSVPAIAHWLADNFSLLNFLFRVINFLLTLCFRIFNRTKKSKDPHVKQPCNEETQDQGMGSLPKQLIDVDQKPKRIVIIDKHRTIIIDY